MALFKIAPFSSFSRKRGWRHHRRIWLGHTLTTLNNGVFRILQGRGGKQGEALESKGRFETKGVWGRPLYALRPLRRKYFLIIRWSDWLLSYYVRLSIAPAAPDPPVEGSRLIPQALTSLPANQPAFFSDLAYTKFREGVYWTVSDHFARYSVAIHTYKPLFTEINGSKETEEQIYTRICICIF